MLPNRPERRIRATIAYDGTDYHGWQIQPGLATIQSTLETVVSEIEERPVTIYGSGRTDAGVHAEAQVAAFSIFNPIPPDNLRRAMNRLLPPAIRVLDLSETALDFHPRFDAVAKTYEYRVFRAEVCPPPLWRYVHHHPYPLDEAAMTRAAEIFVGEHDFAPFASADPADHPEKSKVRRIFTSQLTAAEQLLLFRVKGSGFLKHMVRRMTGALMEVGKGNMSASAIETLLGGAAVEAPVPSVPAKGLHLISVDYEKRSDTLYA